MEGVARPEEVFYNESFCVQGGKNFFADFRLVFGFVLQEDLNGEGGICGLAKHAYAEDCWCEVWPPCYGDNAGAAEELRRSLVCLLEMRMGDEFEMCLSK